MVVVATALALGLNASAHLVELAPDVTIEDASHPPDLAIPDDLDFVGSHGTRLFEPPLGGTTLEAPTIAGGGSSSAR
jgi:hypothetical protein